jgi:hypothetical protein
MTTNTVYIYNFSGATTPNISIHWGNNGELGTSFYAATYSPTTDVTPWKIENIPETFNTYNLWYNGSPTYKGTGYPLIFNSFGIADVYILNDPDVVLSEVLMIDYFSSGTGVDTAYIISDGQYQLAKTFNFPSPFLGFSVPAVSSANMEKLALVTTVFPDNSPPTDTNTDDTGTNDTGADGTGNTGADGTGADGTGNTGADGTGNTGADGTGTDGTGTDGTGTDGTGTNGTGADEPVTTSTNNNRLFVFIIVSIIILLIIVIGVVIFSR